MSPISNLRPEHFYNFIDNMICKKKKMIETTELAVSRVGNCSKISKGNIKPV